MFENKMTSAQGIHYSRYIISWIRSGGNRHDFTSPQFSKWLEANHVTEDEAMEIIELATTGKVELEVGALPYIKASNKYYEELKKEAQERNKLENRIKRKVEPYAKAIRKSYRNMTEEFKKARQETKTKT